jgi:hypothetical protein
MKPFNQNHFVFSKEVMETDELTEWKQTEVRQSSESEVRRSWCKVVTEIKESKDGRIIMK